MTQSANLNIYFVLPEENKDAECSRTMRKAFNCAKQYKGNPKWVLPSFCMSHVPSPPDVFVFDAFSGPAFEKLKNDPAKPVILGGQCMLTCLSSAETIPPGDSPMFTEGMRGLIICCTGFDAPTKKKLQETIEYMAGVFDTALRTITTHVVASNNITFKATQAYIADKPIMRKEWIDAVWERSQSANVRGSDKEFLSYISPLFHNLEITTSGVPKREKEKLRDLINGHGGKFSGDMREQQTHILLINAPVGEKFKAAKLWNIRCLKPEWVRKCVEAGKVLPLKDYSLIEPSNKASTPVKGEVTLSGNFSMVSSIALDDRNFTHIDESNVTAASFQPLSQIRTSSVMDKISEIFLKTKEAGQFLDGCNIFLSGFNQEQFEKLKRIVNLGGGTRFDELSSCVTHIITAGAVEDHTKETGAHVLPLEWLRDSVLMKKPAALDKYITVPVHSNKIAPPSPLSKQSAKLLHRADSRNDLHEIDFPGEEEVHPPADDLMQRYNLSQHAPVQPPPVNNANDSKNHSLHTTKSEYSQENIYQGLKFFLSRDLTRDEFENAEALIVKVGGLVVGERYPGVPDYAVVPILGGILTKITAKEVVNLLFIKDCIRDNELVDIQYYHLPLSSRGGSPLAGCTLTISRYVDSEKDFIEALSEILGANVQAILAKKQVGEILKTSHLICPEPVGPKYAGALRWGLPVVRHEWILKCAELGTRVSEEPFLVGDSKLSSIVVAKNETNNTPVNKRQFVDNSLINSNKAKAGNFNSSEKSAASSGSKNIMDAAGRKLFEGSKINQIPTVENLEVTRRSGAEPAAEDTLSKRSESPTGGEEVNKETTVNELAIEEFVGDPQPAQSSAFGSPSPRKGTRSSGRLTPLNISRKKIFDASTPENISPGGFNPGIPAESYAPSPVNRALERLKQFDGNCNSSPESTGNRTMTPSTPYGLFYGKGNPSPGTRKRLYKWMNQGAELPLDPPNRNEEETREESTPLATVFSRLVKTMMRPEEDRLSDDSYQTPEKRRHVEDAPQSADRATECDLLSGLQKMKEIEASYTKTSTRCSTPVRRCEEPNMVIVAESQPHTEIGWEDPSEAQVHRAVEQPKPAFELKVFMVSAINEDRDKIIELIEDSGGVVSVESHFDPAATHLIASEHVLRGEKLMGSIAAGLWLLHPSYLDNLKQIKDVHKVKEEDFEWGSPKMWSFRQSLPQVICECFEVGYEWRRDIRLHKKSRALDGMKIIINLPHNKRASFERMLKAAGAEIITGHKAVGDQLFALFDPESTDNFNMDMYAKRNIRCVTALFLSDVLLKHSKAVENNYVRGFLDVWNQYNS